MSAVFQLMISSNWKPINFLPKQYILYIKFYAESYTKILRKNIGFVTQVCPTHSSHTLTHTHEDSKKPHKMGFSRVHSCTWKQVLSISYLVRKRSKPFVYKGFCHYIVQQLSNPVRFSRNTGSRSLIHHILLYAQCIINSLYFDAENHDYHHYLKTIIWEHKTLPLDQRTVEHVDKIIVVLNFSWVQLHNHRLKITFRNNSIFIHKKEQSIQGSFLF